MKIKVCGMKDSRNIQELLLLQPDYIGFIFYEASPRYAGQPDRELIRQIPPSIQKVGVFVNHSQSFIRAMADTYLLDLIQLHGDESADFCSALSDLSIIKAFQIGSSFDFAQLLPYQPYCRYFLFDTKSKGYGGSGLSFDWSLLNGYTGGLPFFLSGGIDPDHAGSLKQLALPGIHAIDINSRFEISPGLKDIGKIRQFKNILSAQT